MKLVGNKLTPRSFKKGDILRHRKWYKTTVCVIKYDGIKCIAQYLTDPFKSWIGMVCEIKEEYWELKP